MTARKKSASPLTIADIVAELERRAPSSTAESWDNVGLLAGDPKWKTRSAIVSVDLSAEAVEAAIRAKAKLIVTHHPVIFPKQKGLAKLVTSASERESVSERACRALSQGIAIASYHSNFDKCALEVIDTVARGLGLEPRGRLFDSGADELLKISVFVPRTHLDQVREAICRAGAGQIGNYDQCSFSTDGIGTFRGSTKTDPYLGKPGQLESAKEAKLETIFPKGLKSQVLRALKAAHPYEEIAYDLFRLDQEVAGNGQIRGLGYGFWGEFSKPKRFSEIAQRVTKLFQVTGFWLSEPAPQIVRRMAFSAGNASSFYRWALKQNCELYLGGEFGYHAQLDASNRGLSVIELGHRESELFFLKTMKGWLEKTGLNVQALNIPTQRIWTPRA